jgi:hypothetical protein
MRFHPEYSRLQNGACNADKHVQTPNSDLLLLNDKPGLVSADHRSIDFVIVDMHAGAELVRYPHHDLV